MSENADKESKPPSPDSSHMDDAEMLANKLSSQVKEQFELSCQGKLAFSSFSFLISCPSNSFQLTPVVFPCAPVAAIDLEAVASMNKSATTFYVGMNERLSHLVEAVQPVQQHADEADKFATDMQILLQKAQRLEALVDRLEEYTARQESALARKRR